MRAVTKAWLWGTVALAAASLCAASAMSTGTDGLNSETILSDARFGSAFSGGGARVTDDPDAPIRTGRWGAEDRPAASVELAGGPPPAPAAASAPTSAPIRLAALTRPPTAMPGAARSLASPTLARAAFRPAERPELMGGPVRLSVSSDRDVPTPGSALHDDDDDRFDGASAFVPRPPRASQMIDGKKLLVSIGPAPADRKKGRWFVFAAGSGEAFGLNLIRDPVKGGWRRAGWSVERLAQFGKAQLGVGWRQGNRQVAISAARREFGIYGYKREDTVFGVTFTVSGKPARKVKHENGIYKEAPPAITK